MNIDSTKYKYDKLYDMLEKENWEITELFRRKFFLHA